MNRQSRSRFLVVAFHAFCSILLLLFISSCADNFRTIQYSNCDTGTIANEDLMRIDIGESTKDENGINHNFIEISLPKHINGSELKILVLSSESYPRIAVPLRQAYRVVDGKEYIGSWVYIESQWLEEEKFCVSATYELIGKGKYDTLMRNVIGQKRAGGIKK